MGGGGLIKNIGLEGRGLLERGFNREGDLNRASGVIETNKCNRNLQFLCYHSFLILKLQLHYVSSFYSSCLRILIISQQ